MVGTLALSQLTVQSLTLGRTVRERVVAVNLAREVIEWARGVRDSNWLKGDAAVPWDSNLHDPGNASTTAIVSWNPGTRTFDVTWGSYLIGADNTLLRRTASGVYTTSIVGTTPTIFHRMLTVYPVCWDLTKSTLTEQIASQTIPNATQCAGGLTKVGVDVLVTLQYTDGRTYTTNTEERLYNWRPGSPEL
jgi:hypothetical protein